MSRLVLYIQPIAMASPMNEPIKVDQEPEIKALPDDSGDDRPRDVDPKEEQAFVSALMRSERVMIDY